MVRSMTRHSLRAALMMAVMACATTRALAQDIRIKVDIPRDIARTIERQIDEIVRNVSRHDFGKDLQEMIRSGLAGLDALDQIGDHIGGTIHARISRDDQNRNLKAEEVARETKTLQLGANGSLDLRNIAGDITVTAGTGRDTIVEIEKKSRGETAAEAKAALDKVTVDVTQRGEHATVQTQYPGQRNDRNDRNNRNDSSNVSVSYRVTAPAGLALVIGSTAGQVTVKDMRGDLSINVVAGDINVTNAGRIRVIKSMAGQVRVTGVDSDGTVELGSISGNVIAVQVKARRLVAGVTTGEVSVRDSSCDSAELTSTMGSIEYQGSLAKNGRYELRSHFGAVRFQPTSGAGYDLDASTFSGEIRADSTVSMQGASLAPRMTPRKSIHTTVGDGSAVVVLRTFSGSVTIGK